jgi:hypothetical protein
MEKARKKFFLRAFGKVAAQLYFGPLILIWVSGFQNYVEKEFSCSGW